MYEDMESAPWGPYIDRDSSNPANNQQATHVHSLLNTLGSLSEIASDILHIFYAPRERFTSRKLLDFYRRLTTWHDGIPVQLQLTDYPSAHVLTLQ